MLFDLHLLTSPLVVASDASATGFGVCRTSSLEPKGLLALVALQEGHNFRGEEIGLIEVGTTPGGVRQAFANLKVKPGAYAIVGAREESKKIIQQTWPDAMVSDASTELTEPEITDLMNQAPRCDKWLVAGAQNEPCSIWSTVTLIHKIATSLHQAMPNYSVETLFESRNNLSNTTRVSISELYQLKPIAFRWTGTSSAHGQLIFWVSWKIRANELGEITRGVEIDWIDVQHGEFTPYHVPKHSKSQKEPAINRNEVNLGFPSEYTLPCLPTSAVKTRPKELESVRWSILAATGHPKCAAALVKNLLHMVDIITNDARTTLLSLA